MTSTDQQHEEHPNGAWMAQEGVNRATEVFQKYGAEIRCFVELHARDEAEADDLFQEFFLSLVSTRLPRKVASMRRYLYRAIANDLVSRVRSRQRYQKRLRVYAEARKHQSHQDDPGKETIRTEQTRRVFEMIERHLPPREAEAVACRFHKDWSNREVADHMGVDRRSATRYLCAGLKRLREIGFVGKREPL